MLKMMHDIKAICLHFCGIKVAHHAVTWSVI